MNERLIQEADIVLSKCGRPQAPPGRSIVPLPFGILIQGICQSNTATTLTKEIPGSMPFVIRSIVSTFPNFMYFNIQLPNGRYLLNNEQDVSQLAGIGSYAYLLPRELECPPGSKIEVTMDLGVLLPGVPIALQMLFEGAYIPSVLGSSRPCLEEVAASLPRYWGGQENQNILAPGYMLGYGPKTPEGCRDEIFTYSSNGNAIVGDGGPYNGLPTPGFTMNASAGPFSGIDEIDIEEGSDFAVRRILFDVNHDSGTAGTFLARLRAGSGYALMDDFFDVARLIPGSPIGHDWNLRAGERVFVDLQLVDQSGTGNITIQTFLDGVRRRRK